MRVPIFIIAPVYIIRNLSSACFDRYAEVVQLAQTSFERFIHHRHQHSGYFLRSFRRDFRGCGGVCHNFLDAVIVFYLTHDVWNNQISPV